VVWRRFAQERGLMHMAGFWKSRPRSSGVNSTFTDSTWTSQTFAGSGMKGNLPVLCRGRTLAEPVCVLVSCLGQMIRTWAGSAKAIKAGL
jgi:hypothetical protein